MSALAPQTPQSSPQKSPVKRSHKRKVPLVPAPLPVELVKAPPAPAAPSPAPAPSAPPTPAAATPAATGIELDEDGEAPMSAEEEERHKTWDSFAEEYHDIVAELPLEYQRNFILLKDLELVQQQAATSHNAAIQAYLAHLASSNPASPVEDENEMSEPGGVLKTSTRGLLAAISKASQTAVRAGEDKVALAVALYDSVDRHIRRLDDDLHKYEDSLLIGLRAGTLPSHDAPSTSLKSPPGRTTSRGAIALGEKDAYPTPSGEEKTKRRGRGGEAEQKRKRRRKKEDEKKEAAAAGVVAEAVVAVVGEEVAVVEEGPVGEEPVLASGGAEEPMVASGGAEILPLDLGEVDPSEPTYCYCETVSYGEMIGCDNDDCPREWFHLACVGLDEIPEGDWHCPDCTISLGLNKAPRTHKKKQRRR
ncbi:hypothetical protein RQP46_002890 [Phenoliferia psychrophenolica]